MFKRLVAYYLPFDGGLVFQMPWIWQHARQYAYRNAIACAGFVVISLTADAYQKSFAATAAHGLAMVTIFFTAVFTAAALDPRSRD